MEKYIEKAGAIVCREKNGKKEILLAYRKRGFNDWSFPKGHIEPGETPEIAAKREIKEETGLLIELEQKLPDIFYRCSQGKVRQCTFLANVTGGKLQKNYESNKLEWMPLKEAEQKLSYKNLKELLKKIKVPQEAL